MPFWPSASLNASHPDDVGTNDYVLPQTSPSPGAEYAKIGLDEASTSSSNHRICPVLCEYLLGHHAWTTTYAQPRVPCRKAQLTSYLPTASVDLDECISRLYKKELLAESVIEAICAKTKELLMRESNVVHVQAPVTVVGDIHGQFYDLIEIFRIGGYCPDTNYLFLGTAAPMQSPSSSMDGPLMRQQATMSIAACLVSRPSRCSCV